MKQIFGLDLLIFQNSSYCYYFTVLISTITQIYFNDQLQIKRGQISSLDNELKRLLNELNEINVEKKKVEKSYKRPFNFF